MIIVNVGTSGIASNLRIRCYGSGFVNLSTLSGIVESPVSGSYYYNGSVTAATAYVDAYNQATADYYGLSEYSAPSVVPPTGNPDTRTAYITCRDSAGAVIPNATFHYQIIGVDPDFSDAWNDDIVDTTADSNGLVTITLAVGTYVKYWIKQGRYKTVHITDATVDPYELPSITG